MRLREILLEYHIATFSEHDNYCSKVPFFAAKISITFEVMPPTYEDFDQRITKNEEQMIIVVQKCQFLQLKYR